MEDFETTDKATFSQLFRKYRLRSEFESLSEFAGALADEGRFYEESLFSHWQKGTRVPKNRELLLDVLKVFVKKNGLTTIKEANMFLESASQGYLTDEEKTLLKFKYTSEGPFQVPQEIVNFTGRDELVSQISNLLLAKKQVLIHGPAGVGKTALAIKIGYRLKDKFPDGVLWLRLDTSDPMSILSAIAFSFNENVESITDISLRASAVRSMLNTKKALLIFDNAEKNTNPLIFPSSGNCAVLVTSKNENLDPYIADTSLQINEFSHDDCVALFAKVLGIAYVHKNLSDLSEIAKLLGFLPLAVHVFAKQLKRVSDLPFLKRELSQTLAKGKYLQTLQYEHNDLYASLTISFNALKRDEQNVLVNTAVFAGQDFSLEALAWVSGMGQQVTKKILYGLHSYSLVEFSTNKRFRIHPLVKTFLLQKIQDKEIFEKMINYYIEFLKVKNKNNRIYYGYLRKEVENIFGAFEKSLELHYWAGVKKIFPFISMYLWDSGRWDELERLGKLVNKEAKENNDIEMQIFCNVWQPSWMYYMRGYPEETIKMCYIGLNKSLDARNSYYIALSKLALGKFIQATQKYDNSLLNLKESFAYFQKTNNIDYSIQVLRYIGETYLLKQDYINGIRYSQYALKLLNKVKDPRDIAINSCIIFNTLGTAYLIKNKLKEAEKFFLKSLEIHKRIKSHAYMYAWNNIGLAIIYDVKKDKIKRDKFFFLAKTQINYLNLTGRTFNTVVFFLLIKNTQYKKYMPLLINLSSSKDVTRAI